jgi:hypothetical protein
MAKVTVTYKIPRGTFNAEILFSKIEDAATEAKRLRQEGLFVRDKTNYRHVASDEITSVTLETNESGESIAGAYRHAD